MRRFEEQYRINEGDDVLSRENAIHQDVDLRLDAVEQDAEAFRAGNRADLEAILKSLEQTFGTLAAEMRGLLDQTVGGLSADIVVETTARYFLTDARRGAILSDLRGGVDASGDTMAKLLALIAAVVGGAPVGRQSLKTINDAVEANTATLNAITSGADPTLDSFAEALTRFVIDEGQISSLMTMVGNRLRLDASGGYSDAQKIQGRLNLAAAEAGNSADPNVFDNSAFDWWQRSLTPDTPLSCPTGTRTFLADRVWVNPAGAAVTQQRSTSLPAGSKSLYSLQINGAASVTTVNIGLQRVLARKTARIRRKSTFQVALYNGTGAAFTPSLILSTPSAVDNYGTTAVQLTQALQSVPAGSWAVVSYTGDLSSLTNIGNGLQVEIQIPTGVLVAGKTVGVGEMDLRPGSVVVPFEPRDPMTDLWRCRVHAQPQVLGGFSPAVGPDIRPYGFHPWMGGPPSFINLVVGTMSNAAVTSETAVDQRGGFFQIGTSAANGFIYGRVNLYLWEP